MSDTVEITVKPMVPVTVPLWAVAQVAEAADGLHGFADVTVRVPAAAETWRPIAHVDDWCISLGLGNAVPRVDVTLEASHSGPPDDTVELLVEGNFAPFSLTLTRPVYFAETQRGQETPTVDLLVVGQRWRRNGTMRFLRLDSVNRVTRTVAGTFNDGAVASESFSTIRSRFTRVDR